ncbi:MAG: putative 7-carboxy-7-deazaguanine synthase QueE [Lachnospiraceae bacterium]|nr:putative 7-carboxy-7-deazaguanine synthase QueE [Lachnospiraceae bacterium]
MTYDVVEMFTSINGEGMKAGQLAVFVRLKGCNLNCSYCDTSWANKKDADSTPLTARQIYNKIKEEKVNNVTITGGEPLWRNGIRELLELLAGDKDLAVEIETNGSIDLEPFNNIENRPSFTMDYKLPGSEMETKMHPANLKILDKRDVVKFVAGSRKDLDRARQVIVENDLVTRTNVYISPVFGEIELSDIVKYMKEYNMNGVNMQLQMHKFIWDPQERGV